MKKINVIVIGCTGYIGLELIKILIKHKHISLKNICGNSSAGKNLSYYDKSLKKYKLPKIKKFSLKLLKNIDVIFTALPNGGSQIISKKIDTNKIILIDLSADFRLKDHLDYKKWYKLKHKSKNLLNESIYALPEIKKQKIKKHNIIASPGCYPTSILLPLIPLISNNLIKNNNIIIDSKSGYSGAGRSIHKKFKNKNLYGSLSAYGISNHRHNIEIEQEIKNETNRNIEFTFTPHLSPMFRGIMTTIYVDIKKNSSINKIVNCLKKFYKNSKFINIQYNKLISTNDVIYTNFCKISVLKSKLKNKLIILSTVDNLIKGGAGQAIQSMNIRFGFKDQEGLK